MIAKLTREKLAWGVVVLVGVVGSGGLGSVIINEWRLHEIMSKNRVEIDGLADWKQGMELQVRLLTRISCLLLEFRAKESNTGPVFIPADCDKYIGRPGPAWPPEPPEPKDRM